MASVVYEIAICLLLLVAVRGTGVQPKKIVYVDEVNGTLDLSCWEDNAKLPYSVSRNGSRWCGTVQFYSSSCEVRM